MRIILANGCFDILHIGHILHLQEAKALGGCLIVALTLDEFVNKGPDRPVNQWKYRAAMLRELRSVDGVIGSKSCVEAILKIKPAYFVKGPDYKESTEISPAQIACEQVGTQMHFTNSDKYSTTGLIGILNELRNRQI